MKPRFDLSVLLEMLTYSRPAGSETEIAFIDRFVRPLPNAEIDPFRNWHVTIGDSPILWSCHTDTVHRNDGRQGIRHDPTTGTIALSNRAKKRRNGSSCLGADDTAGVFLCHQMISAGVPGHYVFHFGEERGGIGSADLANERPDLVSGSRFAIALDRQGFGDVITHQSAGRCCSDVFAQSLADQLNRSGLTFAPCDSGIFTDTANYTDTIGECTNLSVGYFHAHSRSETLNAGFLETLFYALCEIDPAGLGEDRQAGEIDPHDRGFCWRGWREISSSSSPLVSDQSLFLEDCEYCGEPFDPSSSEAIDCERYCSPQCEEDDQRHIANRLERKSVFIDPIYEQIANALRNLKG
jgi:hypothetical protein